LATAVGRPASAEMNPGPGFRINAQWERPNRGIIEGFAEFETPAISDQMNRLHTMEPEIRMLTDPARPLVGPALTVKVFPGDNLMVHKSLDIAKPGDVIVVDAGSSSMNAVLGDLICTKARHRGVAGFVVDGLIRDLPAIRALGDVPVFARGVTPIGPLHRGPGEIGGAICAGGLVVTPGDIIVADLNGVVVVPRTDADDVLHNVRSKAASEADYVAAVARGEFSNAWADRFLAEHGLAVDGTAP
jgi:regulator of RNase E activity RraA